MDDAFDIKADKFFKFLLEVYRRNLSSEDALGIYMAALAQPYLEEVMEGYETNDDTKKANGMKHIVECASVFLAPEILGFD